MEGDPWHSEDSSSILCPLSGHWCAGRGGSAVAPRLCPTRCAGQGLSLAKHLRLSPSVRRGWSINAILCVQRSFKGYAERCVQGENKSLFLLRAAGFESCWQLLTSDKVVLFPTRFIFMTDILKIMNKYLQRTSNKLKIIKVQRDEVQRCKYLNHNFVYSFFRGLS